MSIFILQEIASLSTLQHPNIVQYKGSEMVLFFTVELVLLTWLWATQGSAHRSLLCGRWVIICISIWNLFLEALYTSYIKNSRNLKSLSSGDIQDRSFLAYSIYTAGSLYTGTCVIICFLPVNLCTQDLGVFNKIRTQNWFIQTKQSTRWTSNEWIFKPH